MEETTSTGTGETPTPAPTTGAMPNTSSSETPPKPATSLTLEEVLKQKAELEISHKNAREQADRQAKKLASYEKAEKEREAAEQSVKDAQLSEIERIKKQAAELQAKYDAEVTRRQEITARHDIKDAASRLNFVHPDLAHKLLDRSEFVYDDDGNITNAEDLLKTLLKNYPDLAPKKVETPAPTPAQTAPVPNAPTLPPFSGRRSIPSAANQATPGQITKLTDIVWSK